MSNPADAVQQWPIDRLKPFARNARTHSEAQISQIAASIREWGWTVPVLASADGTIIAGHGRVRAAQSLGLAEVPVMVAEGWSEAQVRAYVLADNRIALSAGWDEELLAVELDELRDLKFDLPLIGFAPGELNDLIGTPNTGFDPDEVPPASVVPVSRMGDLWLLGKHRLLCGDSTRADDVARLMGGKKAWLMNTDPPYGIDYSKLKDGIPRSGFKDHQAHWGDMENDDLTDGTQLQAFLEKCIRVAVPHLVDRTAFYLWHPMLTQGTFFAAAAAAADILIHRQIIWVKPGFVLTRSGMYHWKHELCFYGWRRGNVPPWYGDKSQVSVWPIGRDKDAGQHQTQKPVELFAIPIRNHTKDGDVCYEPFAGSGSQIIAAEMTRRACYALEIAPQYVDVSVMRWQTFTGQSATLDSDGRTFEDVRRERSKANTDAPEADQRIAQPAKGSRGRAAARRQPGGATG